jgi:general secretion pathway protein L
MMAVPLSRPTAAAGAFLQGALAWWLAELADMVPETWRARLRRLAGGGVAEDAVVLDLTGPRMRLFLRGRPAPLVLGSAEMPAGSRDQIAGLLRAGRMKANATVRIDPTQLFVTVLDLPASAERALSSLLRHQVERLVPLPAEAVLFAYRILPRAGRSATLKVAVAVAKRPAIDRALAVARGAGLAPARVVAEVTEAGLVPLVLWQPGPAAAQSRSRLRHALEIAAVLLLVAAYGMHVWRLESVRDDLRESVAAATRTAAVTRELGQRVTRSTEALAFLRARLSEPQPLAVLDRLTNLIPLDVWISDLTLRGRTVEILGYAPRAADLIAVMQNSTAFEHPQFRSPITLLPDGHTERFDLTFDVKVAEASQAPPR